MRRKQHLWAIILLLLLLLFTIINSFGQGREASDSTRPNFLTKRVSFIKYGYGELTIHSATEINDITKLKDMPQKVLKKKINKKSMEEMVREGKNYYNRGMQAP